jgi:hypothetical protein
VERGVVCKGEVENCGVTGGSGEWYRASKTAEEDGHDRTTSKIGQPTSVN